MTHFNYLHCPDCGGLIRYHESEFDVHADDVKVAEYQRNFFYCLECSKQYTIELNTNGWVKLALKRVNV